MFFLVPTNETIKKRLVDCHQILSMLIVLFEFRIASKESRNLHSKLHSTHLYLKGIILKSIWLQGSIQLWINYLEYLPSLYVRFLVSIRDNLPQFEGAFHRWSMVLFFLSWLTHDHDGKWHAPYSLGFRKGTVTMMVKHSWPELVWGDLNRLGVVTNQEGMRSQFPFRHCRRLRMNYCRVTMSAPC